VASTSSRPVSSSDQVLTGVALGSGGALLRRLQGCSGLLAVDHAQPAPLPVVRSSRQQCYLRRAGGDRAICRTQLSAGAAGGAGSPVLRLQPIGTADRLEASIEVWSPIRNASSKVTLPAGRFLSRGKTVRADPAGLVGCVEEAAVRGWAVHRSRPSVVLLELQPCRQLGPAGDAGLVPARGSNSLRRLLCLNPDSTAAIAPPIQRAEA
jgi:hypothetical protein